MAIPARARRNQTRMFQLPFPAAMRKPPLFRTARAQYHAPAARRPGAARGQYPEGPPWHVTGTPPGLPLAAGVGTGMENPRGFSRHGPLGPLRTSPASRSTLGPVCPFGAYRPSADERGAAWPHGASTNKGPLDNGAGVLRSGSN